MNKFNDEQLTDGSGVREWEHALFFDTSTWDLGGHEYEILIRDNVTGKTSDPTVGRIDINTPLDSDEAVLVSADAPDTVAIGEDYCFILELGNQSDRDSAVVTKLGAKYDSEASWYTYADTKITLPLPAQDWNTWESTAISFDYAGTVQFRLDALDEIWEVEVSTN